MIFQCLIFILLFPSILLSESASLPISHQGRYRPLGENELHDDLKMIPSKNHPEIWLPLSTLKDSENPSYFSNVDWKKLQEAYNGKDFAKTYFEVYRPQKVYLSKTTVIELPSVNQLKAELWYSHTPLASYAVIGYLLAMFFFLLSYAFPLFFRFGWICLIAAFICHTVLIGTKVYILQRPPVSNMADTLVYVPWISVILAFFWRQKELIAAASGMAAILLTLLEWTLGSNGLENVQPVLNSQFWLIIHVLMIVASYGVFILAGILGHIHLVKKQNDKVLLQLIYFGIALLIPGTILGGIWAAQSWGRFWDWDPKESWAFISACIYLMIVHAYRFGYIGSFGLAVGSIVGLLAISFTWYGVNYIIGTGLHSYGFGSGGEWIYFTYVGLEVLFLLDRARVKKRVT